MSFPTPSVVSNVRWGGMPSATAVESEGSRYFNASCDDLLGYGHDVRVREAQQQALRTWGATLPSGSLLVSRFEEQLAQAFNRTSARLVQQLPTTWTPGQRMPRRVIDGIDPLTGALAPLLRLSEEAAEANEAFGLVDRLGLGILGASGLGIAEHYQLQHRTDYQLAVAITPSLAGHFWAILADAPTFEVASFSTAAVAAASCAFSLSQREPERRLRALELSQQFQAALVTLGFDIGPTVTPWTPLWFGEESLCRRWMGGLAEAGIAVRAFLHPSQSRLLLSLSALTPSAQLEQTVHSFETLKRRIGAPAGSASTSRAFALPGTFAQSADAAAHWHSLPLTAEKQPLFGVSARVKDTIETYAWRVSNFRGGRLRRYVNVDWLRTALDKARKG
jgi:7-keto-8-aminopelargonate synthetase-like enzyme